MATGMAAGRQRFTAGACVHDALSVHELGVLKEGFEQRLAQLVADEGKQDLLTDAMRAATLGGGKRMRPMLLMAAARDLGCTTPAVTDVACAVEMVHAASLILDDMPCMDNAVLRRGKPTIHLQFGEDVAILAAIALLSRAFTIMAQLRQVPSAVRSRLVAKLGQTVGEQGLVRGQFLDLHGAARSAREIAVTNELKTGLLLGVAVEMAALIAQADDDAAKALHAFALAAGQAFQIADDFLDDPANDSALTGKDTGKDTGKSTVINALGAREAERLLEQHLLEAERQLGRAVGPRQLTRCLAASLFGARWPTRAPGRRAERVNFESAPAGMVGQLAGTPV